MYDEKLWGFVDERGKVIIEPQYQMTFDFIDGLAIAEKNDSYGLIDENNSIILEFENSYIDREENGFFVLSNTDGEILINTNGNCYKLNRSLQTLQRY